MIKGRLSLLPEHIIRTIRLVFFESKVRHAMRQQAHISRLVLSNWWARFLRSSKTEPDRFIIMLKDIREAASCGPNIAILQDGAENSCEIETSTRKRPPDIQDGSSGPQKTPTRKLWNRSRQPGQPYLGSLLQDVRGHPCRVHGNSSDIFNIGFSFGILTFDLIVSNRSSPSEAPSFAAQPFGGDLPCRSCHFPRYNTTVAAA